MNKEQYARYLLSAHWRIFRERVILRTTVKTGYRCERCAEILPRSKLEVHHKHYRSIGRERPQDVLVICGKCHGDIHDKPKEQEQHMPTRTRNRRDQILSDIMAIAYERLRPIHKRMIDGLITQEHFDAIKREFIDLLLINSERNLKE